MKRAGITRDAQVILAMMGAYAALMGFRNAAISITLAQRHLSAGAIGMNGLGQCGAMLLAAFVLPRAISRVGCKGACSLALGAEAAALAMLALSDNLVVWFFARVLLGVSTAALCAAGETLLGAVVPENVRGRVMGIYTSILGIGLSAGPAMLGAAAAGGFPPFQVVWLLVGVTAILVRSLSDTNDLHEAQQSESSIRQFMTQAPIMAVLFVLVGIKDTSQSTFLPIVGLQSGLSSASASLLLSASVLGGVMTPAFIGTYADKTDRRLLLAIVSLLYGVLTFALVNQLDQPILRIVTAVALGGAGSSIFTIGMTLVGARFAGPALTAAYVATGSLWGVGSLLGNLLVGSAISGLGKVGFAVSTGIPFCLGGLLCLWHLGQDYYRQAGRGTKTRS